MIFWHHQPEPIWSIQKGTLWRAGFFSVCANTLFYYTVIIYYVFYVFYVFIYLLSINIYYVPASIIIHSLCCTDGMREKHSGVAEKPRVCARRKTLHDPTCVCVPLGMLIKGMGSNGRASTMGSPPIHCWPSSSIIERWDLSTLVIFSHHLRALASMNTTNMQWLAISSPLDKDRLTKLEPFINQCYHELTIIERLTGHQ